ncbi:MAG: penicillin-binding protein 2 [Lentimicrobiaceae bacterium]|nr:penicillin-binding protein 2 [Lentimicrobiaceae bacterium]
MKNSYYSNRKYIIIITFIIVGIIFALRLFYIQVIDRSYTLSANNNVLRYITQYPARGLIYDRNGKLLVFNEAVYDLMVTPNHVKNIDTTEFCTLVGIDKAGFIERIEKARKYSPYKASAFEKQISKEAFGYLEEKLYRFHGFFVQPRTIRKYPQSLAAHLLGYIGEATQSVLDKVPYYKSGDYIGISGIEKSYEEELRGVKGMKIRMVDVFNREQGSFQNEKYDTAAIMGKNLYTSLDAGLQAYGELLMAGKRGSIVAIEPSTGEILAFLSSPTYDPNLLVGRVRSKNYQKLSNDPVKPLLNRALMGQYPPGSTFKIVNDLIGLEEGVLFPSTFYSCQGPGTSPIRCTHNHVSPLDLKQAIQQSCNPYHWQVFRSIINKKEYGSVKNAYNAWQDYVTDLGFGIKYNSDLPYELDGNIPESEYFDKIYGKGHWNAMTIRSFSIGQGEILTTPLQLANLACIIANRGYYITPHLVRSVGSPKSYIERFTQKHQTKIHSQYYDFMVEAMFQVVEHGTAAWYKLDSIPMCGKTGTAQNPHGKDHSLFICFAPKDHPKIAMAVIVENAGFGSTWAVPIASLLIEKYLTGTVKRKDVEQRMIEFNMISKP